MENEMNETVSASFDSMVRDIVCAKQAAFEAQLHYENTLRMFAQAHGNTYQHENQWFQIRHRFSAADNREVWYLCTLKAEPKTWLGASAKKRRKGDSTVMQPAQDPVDVVTSASEEETSVEFEAADEVYANSAFDALETMPDTDSTTVIE
ncbi:hypothetical protein HC928_02250 [bacterium]|nr:hypothetical protein [bacterium]